MDKKILVMNDLPGYGKVALAAAQPILSHFGYHVYNLPTALVSNTLNYGKYQILDTTEYMRETVKVWQELGFTFDAVMTGFIVSHEQLLFVKEFCEGQADRGTKIIVDPIMGDYGRLYHGVSDQTVQRMRELCKSADYVIPNFTEATFLADVYKEQPQVNEKQTGELVDKLRGERAQSVVITSVPLEGEQAVVGYDKDTGERFFFPYKQIPAKFPGTGDIFSALMTAELLGGKSLKDAVGFAMRQLGKMLTVNVKQLEQYGELSLEPLFQK